MKGKKKRKCRKKREKAKKNVKNHHGIGIGIDAYVGGISKKKSKNSTNSISQPTSESPSNANFSGSKHSELNIQKKKKKRTALNFSTENYFPSNYLAEQHTKQSKKEIGKTSVQLGKVGGCC